MTDWYCSSAAYATYTAFQGSHLYSIGDILVPTAPTIKNKWVFRCTTGGTSTTEPNWAASASGNNGTVTSGTATFTNVTGQSAFFWTAASGDMATLQNQGTGSLRAAAGDRIFVSSDHSETTGTYGGAGVGATYTVLQILCVNRAGSTPPVAADLTTGATLIASSTMTIEALCPCYCYGITFSHTGTTGIQFANSGLKSLYLDNCQLWLNTSTATASIFANDPVNFIMNNSTVKFNNAGQAIRGSSGFNYPLEIIWQNTSSALAGATMPTVLFQSGTSSAPQLITCRGVDLSGTTGTLVQGNSTGGPLGGKYLLDSCKIASGVTRYSTTNATNTRDLVELVNCYDGTNIISESYQVCGTLTTETTITLSGGAVDDVGAFSHKIVTNANVDKFVNTFNSFWMDVENTTTGSPKTATVEIISSTALNNDEIALYLQYEGTAGSSVASFGNSFILTPLTTAQAVTTSTATWNSSPSTPQKQKCQVSFTPQHAGRLRGQIRVGKASCTVYINPQIAVT